MTQHWFRLVVASVGSNQENKRHEIKAPNHKRVVMGVKNSERYNQLMLGQM